MVRKKINAEDIDEEFLISTINNDKQASEHTKETGKPQQPAKKNRLQKEYMALFIHQSESKARAGKLVPVRPEYHERILKIVRIIAGDEISIFNYIDNILTHHFEEYQEEIIKNYEEKNKDIF
jgi:hypothetical protein